MYVSAKFVNKWKSAQRVANTARWRSQTFSPRRRPRSWGRRRAKI